MPGPLVCRSGPRHLRAWRRAAIGRVPPLRPSRIPPRRSMAGTIRAAGGPVAAPSTKHFFAASLVLVRLFTAAPASGQSALIAARDLYRNAAYDDALALLNPLHAASQPAEDGPI